MFGGGNPFEEWNKLYGKGAANAENFSALLQGLPNITRESDSPEESIFGHAPSLGLFGEESDDDDENLFVSRENEKFPMKEVSYIPDTDIEPVTIGDDLISLGNDRCFRWKYMKIHLEYYLKSKYRLSAYISALGEMLEEEMDIRTKEIPIALENTDSENGFVIEKSTKIHGWGVMECVDTSSRLGQQTLAALSGSNVGDINDPVIRNMYEAMIEVYQECEKFNREDNTVLTCMKYIVKRIEDSLIKASKACQCLSCYTQTRDDQDNEMREVALARYTVDRIGSSESKYCQVNPKDYVKKKDYYAAKEANIVAPEMDWIWEILKNFSSEGGKGAGGFAGISFQRNTAFVNDLTECCIYLWTAFARLSFLINMDEYIQSDTVPSKLKSLYCMVVNPLNITTEETELEELMNRSGVSPVLDYDTPIMSLNLHTTMLSVAELNSNLLECPMTQELVEYTHQLYGRYCSFSWFLFTENELMNAQAYIKSVQLKEKKSNTMDKYTNEKKKDEKEEEEEEETLVIFNHVNKFFLRYGWNMLFPCLQAIRITQGIESLLDHKFYIASKRSDGIPTGMTTEVFSHVREWGHEYMKKECARLSCESYNAEVVQYMLRPGEMKMFKLKHDRGDTHPMNVINNLRPYDMDRVNKSLLNTSPEDILDVKMFPLRLKEDDMVQRGKERIEEAKQEHDALASLMKVEGLKDEYLELLNIMQSGVDTTGGTLDKYERGDSFIELDRIIPYGTKTCNDYLYYCLFNALCYEKGSIVKTIQVVFMREMIEHELPYLFSESLGVKITNISSPHNMKKFLKKSPVKREKIHRVREHPGPIICQLVGGYSVIWFSSSVVYHCETFIESLFYLSICYLRYLLDCCIYGKLDDVILGDIYGGECAETQRKLEDIMKRNSRMSGMSRMAIRDESLDTFKRESVGIYVRTAHDLIECAEQSETGLPEKWKSDIDKITFWYYIIIHVFGIYPASLLDENLFSEEEEEGEEFLISTHLHEEDIDSHFVRNERFSKNVHQADI